MMASAMLRAGVVLGDRWAADHALLTLARIREESTEPDAIAHTPGGVADLLDDQVQVAAAALDAYELTGSAQWLDWSERLMERVWADYWDQEAGGLFDIARDRANGAGLLPARAKPIQDTPTPSPNGVAGLVVARLSELTGAARWQERRTAIAAAFAGRAGELGLHGATYLLLVDWEVNPATHLIIVGDPGDPTAQALHRTALAGFIPRRVVQFIAPANAPERPLPPALRGMLTAGEAPRAYACAGTSCSPPAADLGAWQATLESLRSIVPA